MKFKAAVGFSIVLHVSLFALTFYFPQQKSKSGETVYYVDLMSFGSGSGRGGRGKGGASGSLTIQKGIQSGQVGQVGSGKMRDLTVKKDFESSLRYPDINKKNKSGQGKVEKKKEEKKEEKQDMISVVRKDITKTDQDKTGNTQTTSIDKNIFNMGISSSTGIGLGNGTGDGTGDGDGEGDGNGGMGGNGISSPYGYYYQTLINRVSSSWYYSLVSPGLKGKYVSTVYFKIFRNGQMAELRIETASGIDSLDLSALRAIENASPFPPLPYDFPYSYLVVHFDFTWEK